MSNPSLPPDQYNALIKLLLDFVKTPEERQALIHQAFTGQSIVGRLDYSGSAVTFCANAIDRLYVYDREFALVQPGDEESTSV